MHAIITALDNNGGELHGTRNLANKVNAPAHIARVMKWVRKLEGMGEITINRACGGRGHKTIYKRNRTNPGLPRKVKR
jgi:hypothetical protein